MLQPHCSLLRRCLAFGLIKDCAWHNNNFLEVQKHITEHDRHHDIRCEQRSDSRLGDPQLEQLEAYRRYAQSRTSTWDHFVLTSLIEFLVGVSSLHRKSFPSFTSIFLSCILVPFLTSQKWMFVVLHSQKTHDQSLISSLLICSQIMSKVYMTCWYRRLRTIQFSSKL